MATLHQVVEELQYSNLQQEEHTERLEEIELVMMELNETFTRSFQGFVDVFTANLDVQIDDLADTLAPTDAAVTVEEPSVQSKETQSTEDRREQRAIAQREMEALETTADLVAKIYELMVDADKRAKEEAAAFDMPAIVPLGAGRRGPVTTPTPKDKDGDDSKKNKSRWNWNTIKGKLGKGGLYGGIAYLGMEALGINPSEIMTGIGSAISNATRSAVDYINNTDMTQMGKDIVEQVDRGINGLIDLIFPADPVSMEEQIGTVAVAAGIGFTMAGPIGAFIAGLSAWISTSFTSDEIQALKADLVSDITSFVNGIKSIFTDDEVQAAAKVAALTQVGYEEAINAGDESVDVGLISEVGVTPTKTPDQLEIAREEAILADLTQQLMDAIDNSRDAAEDYDSMRIENKYREEYGDWKELIPGNTVESVRQERALELQEARKEYEDARAEMELLQSTVNEQQALVQSLVTNNNNETKIIVTKPLDQKPTGQK